LVETSVRLAIPCFLFITYMLLRFSRFLSLSGINIRSKKLSASTSLPAKSLLRRFRS
jgi:hypothetical protein